MLMVEKIINKIFLLLRVLIHNRKYIQNGLYRVNQSFTVLYSTKVMKRVFDEEKYLFDTITDECNMYRKIFSQIAVFPVVSLRKRANANIILLSTQNDYVKLFDYDKNMVINCYNNNFALERDISNKIKWSEYFKVVPFKIDRNECTLIEQLIQKRDIEPEKMFLKVIKEYAENDKLVKTKVVRDTSYMIEKLTILSNWLKMEMIQETELYLSNNSCYSLTHGDLWNSNLLFDGSEVYFIDFECLEYRFFFYDIFCFMFSEALLRSNETLLRKYFNNVFDEFFIIYFSLYEQKFNTDYKMVYFNVFLITYFMERWESSSEGAFYKEIQQIINVYR